LKRSINPKTPHQAGSLHFERRRRLNLTEQQDERRSGSVAATVAEGFLLLSPGKDGRVPELTPADTPAFKAFRDLGEFPPEPDWLWRGYLSPGALTLLAGHPFAGKSMLVAGLLRALAEGHPFLDQETTRGSALLVTEEEDSVLRQRAELLGLLDLDGMYLSRNSGATRYPWQELVAAAADRAVMDGHSLLVFDTFPGLAQLGDEQENDAGAISERLRPLLTAASLGLAILVLHHMNGYGQPRGSKAFRGIVDVVVRFHREKDNNIRLEAESRFPTATPPRLRGQLVKAPGRWFYTARSDRVRAEGLSTLETDALLKAALIEAGASGLTYEEIDQLAGLSTHMAKRRLPAWHANDQIRRKGSGVKADPYRWFAFPS
jgi:hypothetical protein